MGFNFIEGKRGLRYFRKLVEVSWVGAATGMAAASHLAQAMGRGGEDTANSPAVAMRIRGGKLYQLGHLSIDDAHK